MVKHTLIIPVLCGLLVCLNSHAQTQPTVINNCPYANHLNDLACLIPDLTKTGKSSNLSGFNTTLAQVLGQLPLAVPVSGFALSFDKSLGILVTSSDTLGSVLTERGDTIGKHKLFVGFTFQRFVFHSIDGNDLNSLPTVFQIPGSGIYGHSDNSLGANINQYTAIAAFGVTDRVDVSLTLPFQRISLSAAHGTVVEATNGGPPPPGPRAQSISGSASGPGDLILNTKATVWKSEHFRVAGGTEIRFPSGDQYNLLGSGAWGVKPYVVISRRGRITPHVNFGYQWNGRSVLVPSSTGGRLELPDSLQYSAGADIGVLKRLTVVADFLGQHFFDAPRVTRPTASTLPNLPAALSGFTTIGVVNDSYDENNLGVGLKVNPFGRLLVSANVLIKLNDAGLRSDFVPLVGVSYKF